MRVRVADMGHIWREKTVSDVGIDGEIELVDPTNRHALARILLVQSKARSGQFERETASTFSFRCTEDDLEYWLSATAPVLLVGSHPEDKCAWFKNVNAWFAEHPDLKRSRTIEFDKAADRFDTKAANALFDWGVPTATGIYLRPPPRTETLTSNLLRVEHLAPNPEVRTRAGRHLEAVRLVTARESTARSSARPPRTRGTSTCASWSSVRTPSLERGRLLSGFEVSSCRRLECAA